MANKHSKTNIKRTLPDVSLKEKREYTPVNWSIDPRKSLVDDRGALIVIRFKPHHSGEKDEWHYMPFRFSRGEFNFLEDNFEKVFRAQYLSKKDKEELKGRIDNILFKKLDKGFTEKELVGYFETDEIMTRLLKDFAKCEAEIRLMAVIPW